jgi:hypothetical protein
MCAEVGYYEISSGYRSIPGDICTGGLQLEPIRYSCSPSFVGSIFSFSGFFMCSILAALLYFGWPIIEAILIALPIPDPIVVKEQFVKALMLLKSLPAAFSGNGEKNQDDRIGVASGYRQDFDQVPGSLQDDEDDDEEDVGRVELKDSLNYDSDEREGNELISLDSQPKKNVPKLRQPRK